MTMSSTWIQSTELPGHLDSDSRFRETVDFIIRHNVLDDSTIPFSPSHKPMREAADTQYLFRPRVRPFISLSRMYSSLISFGMNVHILERNRERKIDQVK
jgi:hypothetical protein